MNFLGLLRDVSQPGQPTPEEAQYLGQVQHWLTEEVGYQWIQGTKPQTLSYGLTDSPVGLAAWMVEKFRSWSDCGGDVERCFTKDELLTAVMLYWVTGAINAAFWPYYARRHGDWDAAAGPRIEVPTAYIDFPARLSVRRARWPSVCSTSNAGPPWTVVATLPRWSSPRP